MTKLILESEWIYCGEYSPFSQHSRDDVQLFSKTEQHTENSSKGPDYWQSWICLLQISEVSKDLMHIKMYSFDGKSLKTILDDCWIENEEQWKHITKSIGLKLKIHEKT